MEETEVQAESGLAGPSILPPDTYTELARLGLAVDGDGIVSWGPDCRLHPRNWSLGRKVYDTGMVLFLEAFETIISTAGVNAGHAARDELQLGEFEQIILFTSLYLIGQAVGGLLLPAYSESFGRKWLYVGGALLYAVFSAVMAARATVAAVVMGRFATGLLSAIPFVVAPGTIEDMWDTRARVWIFFLAATGANIAMVLGPIISLYLIEGPGWRCIFYLAAGVCSAASLMLALMRESRPSLILRRAVAGLRQKQGGSGSGSGSDDDDTWQFPNLTTRSPDYMPDLATFLHTSLLRPARLFCTEIIVFTLSIMTAVAMALVYLFAEVMPPIFASYTDPPLSRTERVVPWLALGLGFLLGGLTRAWDHRRLRRHRTADIEPEHKLIGFALAAPALAAGLWWFAWTVPPASPLHWSVPAASLVPVGWAVNEFDIVLTGYITDAYQAYAASAFGAMNLVRSILSALFPLFAPDMYRRLGQNYAGTILAMAATLFCLVPPMFVKYGATIRKKSKFATWSSQNGDPMVHEK